MADAQTVGSPRAEAFFRICRNFVSSRHVPASASILTIDYLQALQEAQGVEEPQENVGEPYVGAKVQVLFSEDGQELWWSGKIQVKPQSLDKDLKVA